MSDAAFAIIASCLVTVTTLIVGFLTLWVRLKYGEERARDVETKIDRNTEITTAGAKAAVENARVAARSAASAVTAVENIDRKLNGGIDAAIQKSIDEHIASDERNMALIDARFVALTDYVHNRVHDILNGMHAQSAKIDLILARTDKQQGSK